MDTQTETRDCGDNSCKYKARGRGGMRTNGGCRCDSCPYCGANCDPRFNMDRHRDHCAMKRFCVNCGTLDHAENGACLFNPGTFYDASEYDPKEGRISWKSIGPVIAMVRRKLSPEGGKINHDEVSEVLKLRIGPNGYLR